MRADFRDWSRAQCRSQLGQEPARFRDRYRRFAFGLQLGDIFFGNPGKGIGGGNPFRNPGFTLGNGRIAARLGRLARLVAPRAGQFQAEFGITAQRQLFFLTVESIF